MGKIQCIRDTHCSCALSSAKFRSLDRGRDDCEALSMIEPLVTLHRYYIWANQMRVHFDEILSKSELGGAPQIKSFLYMSYWYAALYVVIEGWRELELADATIDALLQSPNVDLLKRYRNGVFHFQKDYNDERFQSFMRGEDSVPWVRSLNQQFGRYFLDHRRTADKRG